jgi:O-antigen ligase
VLPSFLLPLVLLGVLIPLGAPSWNASLIASTAILSLFVVDLLLSWRSTTNPGPLPVHFQDSTFLVAFCLLPGMAFVQYALATAGVSFTEVPRIGIAQFAATSAAALALYRMVCVRPPHELWFLAWALALILLGEAAYGLLNLASGNEYLLLSPRKAYPDSVTGTLVSRNHFAFLMEMGIPLWIGLAAASSAARKRGPVLPESENRMRSLMFMAPAVGLFLALFFSRSRMGVMAAVLAGVGAMLLNRWRISVQKKQGHHTSAQGSAAGLPRMVTVVVLLALVYAAAAGLDQITERFLRLPADLESGRLPLWTLALEMFADQPLFGHGFGGFEYLTDAYRSSPTGLTFAHAHNELVEIAMEAGLAGLLAIGYLLFSYLRFCFDALRRCRSWAAPVLLGTITGINSVLLHSGADFGLRIPGVLLCFAYLAGLAHLAGIASRGRSRTSSVPTDDTQ